MKNFIDLVLVSLEETMVDGGNSLGSLIKIVGPLMLSDIFIIVIYSF